MQNSIFNGWTWRYLLQIGLIALLLGFLYGLVQDAEAFGRRRYDPVVVTAPSVPTGPTGFILGPIKGTAEEATKIKEAELIINQLVDSKCFEDFFLHRALVQTRGMSNAQVVEYIREAYMKAPVEFYYQKSIVMGYVTPPSKLIHMNRYYHDAFTSCDEASVAGHELLHDIGFEHDYEKTSRRPYSVPYSWSAMAHECCPYHNFSPEQLND